jgi:transcription termination/antitermination protein NusG
MMEKFKWYALHLFSGYEDKVVADIWKNAEKANFSKFIKEIYVPKEKVVKRVRGKQVASERSSFSGYIFIKAVLTDHVHNLIKDTDRVTNFLTTANNEPVAISETELQKIKTQSEANLNQEVKESFDIGERVKMTDGAFAGFDGVIKEVLDEGNKFKIEVTIFGRPAMIDLAKEFIQRIAV